MSVEPPVAGASAAFACNVCTNLFKYIKNKKKRVKKLVTDFAQLKGEVAHLNACWDDTKDQPGEKNNQYTAVKNKVDMFDSEFKKIEKKYTKYCKNLEIQNQTTAASSGANVHQAITNAPRVPSNGANVHQASTNAPAGEFGGLSNVGQPKIWTRKFFKLAQLDKDIVELMPKIIAVKNEIQNVDLLSQGKPKVVVMGAYELKNIIPSHEKHLADLKEYLCRENCKRIGIYGPPDVGKTNVMKNLNNSFDPSTSSDCNLGLEYVIWVDVPDEPAKEEMTKNNRAKEEMIENIQGQILQRLNIDVQKYKNWNPADIISTELSKKKYLLLLDNFSSSIELEKIGIREDHKGGKVVIEAQNFTVLRKVNVDERFKVDYLSPEDKERLFNKFVEIDTLDVELRKMVYPILKEVGGLPGWIRSAAEYLKEDRDEQIWEGFKQRLQSEVATEFQKQGGHEKAYRLYYDKLEDNPHKKCLLYAALFPDEHKIRKSTLVECWKAEQFFSFPTMAAARNEGACIFLHLEKKSLLQSYCEEYVKMPKFFRKIALGLRFPEEDGVSIVRLGQEIDRQESKWKDARRVPLMRSHLKKLPSSPQYDRISTLLLQLNPRLETIEDPFFSSMKTLRVLDLHRTGISLLPSSISNLTALRCLYLDHCGKLTKLPTKIRKLKALEVLDIRGTLIRWQPEEISSLISLSCLRISFVACNPNPESKKWVLFKSKPHKLEELTIASGRTGISEEIRSRIKTEVSKSTKVRFIDPCIQRPFPSLDQENLSQSGEGTNLLNPSLPENPGHDEVSKNDKGKGIAVVNGQNFSAGASTSGTVGRAD